MASKKVVRHAPEYHGDLTASVAGDEASGAARGRALNAPTDHFFRAGTYMGDYGYLVVDSIGDWTYTKTGSPPDGAIETIHVAAKYVYRGVGTIPFTLTFATPLPTTNLTNFWSLKAAKISGTALAADVGVITGTLQDSDTGTASAAHFSASANGVHCDGAGRIKMSACPLPAAQADFSMSLWWQPDDFTFIDSYGASSALLSTATAGGDELRICSVEQNDPWVDVPTGNRRFSVIWARAQDNFYLDFGVNVSDLAEHHFAFTVHDQTVLLYMDGALVTSPISTGDLGAFNAQKEFHLFSQPTVARGRAQGGLRDVAVYDTKLDAATIHQIYLAGRP